MLRNAQAAARAVAGFTVAAMYQVATNPFVVAGLLVLPYLFGKWWPAWLWNGHWPVALWLLLAWGVVHALAVAFSQWTISPLTGARIRNAPRFLWALGNDQDGYLSRSYLHPTWSWWLVAFTECAWRNKLRNLPFYPGLRWLHRPSGKHDEMVWRFGNVFVSVRWRGWMTEVEYFGRKRFGDFGPRLDQPDEWGGVSWAFRPWGRI